MYTPKMARKIVNECAVIQNMRIHYRLPIEQINGCIQELEQERMYDNFERNNEIIERRGPRVVAMRVQKQLMASWFFWLYQW